MHRCHLTAVRLVSSPSFPTPSALSSLRTTFLPSGRYATPLSHFSSSTPSSSFRFFSSSSSSSRSSPFNKYTGVTYQPHDKIRPPNLALAKRNKNRSNIVIMGPPGSGKTSVARSVGRLLNMRVIDVDDDLLEPAWGMSVAQKLIQLGDEGFIAAEGQVLKSLNVENTIISLSGSNPLHPESMEHIAKNGTIVYLDIDKQMILNRMSQMKVDRIVGQSTSSLSSILDFRLRCYENAYDHRILISADFDDTKRDSATETSVDFIASQVKQVIQTDQAFVSTRGQRQTEDGKPYEFLDVVRQGLSNDRGLFVSPSFHPFTMQQIKRLAGLSYPELALRVMERFPLGSLPPNELRSLLYNAYSTFHDSRVLPIHPLQHHHYLLETFYGPTASFKDLSLQLLPSLLHAANVTPTQANPTPQPQSNIGLLVATSGDTGTAALSGFARQSSGPIIVFYPRDGVSPIQKLQMLTAQGPVYVCGIDADFDYCQTLVKDIFNTPSLLSQLTSPFPHLSFSSANSINWGRFLPQIVFTFSGYLQLLQRSVIKLGEPIDVVIPTGNFGNILGAVYARQLGLPIRQLVCASNSNHVLADFIATGNYDLRKRPFHQTVSPSIDILVSSNLERFLYALSGGDASLVSELFQSLATQQHFSVPHSLRQRLTTSVQGVWCSEQDCLQTIQQVFHSTKQLIDPHTAVAKYAADVVSPYMKATKQVPVLISSTAHFAKFPSAMLQALTGGTTPNANSNASAFNPSLSSVAGLGANMRGLFDELLQLKPDAHSTIHPDLFKVTQTPLHHYHTAPADKQVILANVKQWLNDICNKH